MTQKKPSLGTYIALGGLIITILVNVFSSVRSDERMKVNQKQIEKRIVVLENKVEKANINVLNNELIHLKKDVSQLVKNDEETNKLLTAILLRLPN